MFKDVIAPIQAWLISQGRCVGCGRELSSGKVEKRRDGTERVSCECKRIYIRDPKTKKYHRALIEEA
ncbi:hypothetical protein A2627_05405 [Candidatus Woesebacteria bacterium RIFCSPHIGHO2_01_FULL_39_28]|uniref:Uncharacterized protein n=1 Tax=Candidatus Woesebacteria bacterium RIFCSPHIGHO2_01_FULL_39_28 TaxID=1802496 RepID=A0A1F7YFE1_9BACT|nr:MAG: hypothetical protein A2627_05405 [Candidatus Woesebacteria bacterium RIFCSPHIGHO2_01_FULL_39_28]OGM58214.1 MAG: hypothetical protein A3A50_04360 [Candidatus Woesebacteria bacterium RIFCSPLOWO2_01_FULL_38_20]